MPTTTGVFWSADSSAVPVPTRLPLWPEGTSSFCDTVTDVCHGFSCTVVDPDRVSKSERRAECAQHYSTAESEFLVLLEIFLLIEFLLRSAEQGLKSPTTDQASPPNPPRAGEAGLLSDMVRGSGRLFGPPETLFQIQREFGVEDASTILPSPAKLLQFLLLPHGVNFRNLVLHGFLVPSDLVETRRSFAQALDGINGGCLLADQPEPQPDREFRSAWCQALRYCGTCLHRSLLAKGMVFTETEADPPQYAFAEHAVGSGSPSSTSNAPANQEVCATSGPRGSGSTTARMPATDEECQGPEKGTNNAWYKGLCPGGAVRLSERAKASLEVLLAPEVVSFSKLDELLKQHDENACAAFRASHRGGDEALRPLLNRRREMLVLAWKLLSPSGPAPRHPSFPQVDSARVLMLLLEAELRAAFAHANGDAESAKARHGEYYCTLDGYGQRAIHQVLLDPEIFGKPGVKNKLLQQLSPGCVHLLQDLFLQDGGPNVRAGLFHNNELRVDVHLLLALVLHVSGIMDLLEREVAIPAWACRRHVGARSEGGGQWHIRGAVRDFVNKYEPRFHPVTMLCAELQDCADACEELERYFLAVETNCQMHKSFVSAFFSDQTGDVRKTARGKMCAEVVDLLSVRTQERCSPTVAEAETRDTTPVPGGGTGPRESPSEASGGTDTNRDFMIDECSDRHPEHLKTPALFYGEPALFSGFVFAEEDGEKTLRAAPTFKFIAHEDTTTATSEASAPPGGSTTSKGSREKGPAEDPRPLAGALRERVTLGLSGDFSNDRDYELETPVLLPALRKAIRDAHWSIVRPVYKRLKELTSITLKHQASSKQRSQLRHLVENSLPLILTFVRRVCVVVAEKVNKDIGLRTHSDAPETVSAENKKWLRFAAMVGGLKDQDLDRPKGVQQLRSFLGTQAGQQTLLNPTRRL
eukprot:g13342.t1